MAQDDIFEPRLGKIRSQPIKAPKSFRSRALRSAGRAGGLKMSGGNPSPAASKRGRGSGVARVVTSGSRRGAGRRRVVIKARYVKLAGNGRDAAAAHLKYIQRDGVTREGTPGQMYGADADRADGDAFTARSFEDERQFRFIVAPEDGDQYPDLKPYTRRLMAQMEEDLGTRLDWVAVDHYNTGHPHTHIVVRGVTDAGQDLVISREYLSQGFRARAEALVELDLGPASDQEIATRLNREVGQERLTSIDRQFLREADADCQVLSAHRDPEMQAMRAGRLQKLGDLGLAQEVEPGRWQLRADLEKTLRGLGERGDIIKMMHHELKARNMDHAVADSRIHDADPALSSGQRPVVGRVLKRGILSDGNDRQYVMLEGVDGRVHMIDIGPQDRTASLPEQSVVRITFKVPSIRNADRNIAEVAAANGGYYDIEAHLAHDPSARQAFAETHARRLEAIRRSTGAVTREPDGRFKIGSAYLEQAMEHERRQVQLSPVQVDVLATQTLDQQTRRQGLTWLDDELAAGTSPMSGTGFGEEVRSALNARRQWLAQEELLDGSGNPKAGFKATLHRRELLSVADEVARSTGLTYREAQIGERVEGTLRRSVTLGVGKYAVVERARDFTLVPWRPALDNHIGKAVSGIMRNEGINWTIGRPKGLGVE